MAAMADASYGANQPSVADASMDIDMDLDLGLEPEPEPEPAAMAFQPVCAPQLIRLDSIKLMMRSS